jgi:hypothetical protein
MAKRDGAEPVFWEIGDYFYAAHQYQETFPGEYIAIGYVCDSNRVPIGLIFHLTERDGEIVMLWEGPPEVFERVQSMYSAALTDWYDEVEDVS